MSHEVVPCLKYVWFDREFRQRAGPVEKLCLACMQGISSYVSAITAVKGTHKGSCKILCNKEPLLTDLDTAMKSMHACSVYLIRASAWSTTT